MERILDDMTQTLTGLHVQAIDPTRLAAIRRTEWDEHGNPLVATPADGGEPLRCCLRRAEEGDSIALISYAPFLRPSPWREVGPVFIHAAQCEGYEAVDELPPELRTGPRVLRTYRADGSLDYDHITIVAEGEDIEPDLARLLDEPEVETVHVRALVPQCFTYAVVRAG